MSTTTELQPVSAQTLEHGVRCERWPQVRGVVSVIHDARLHPVQQSFEKRRTEGKQVALNHGHVGAARHQNVTQPVGQEQSIERRLLRPAPAAMLDQSLVRRLGHRAANNGIDPGGAQIRQVLQHAVGAAGVGRAIQQKEMRLHRALPATDS